MAETERYFLNGMLRYLKPRKILEAGIAQGGGTSIILNAIQDIEDAHLFSIDYATQNHFDDQTVQPGHLVEKKFSHLKDKWTRFLGGDVSKHIEKVGNEIDLMILDTAHIHPWESLNFLCVLPFLKINNSWVILHDVSLQYLPGRDNDLACRYLWESVVSDKKLQPSPDYIPHFSNIGAFKITDDTIKYIGNVFEELLNPWLALPLNFEEGNYPFGTKILPEDLESIKNIISKYYDPDCAKFLEHVIEFQNGIAEHKNNIYKNKKLALKDFMRRSHPKVLKILKAIKHIVK